MFKRIISFLAVITMITGMLITPASAVVGPGRDKDPDGTTMFVLGDSRILQMFDRYIYNMPGASSNQGTGHYKGSGRSGWIIDTDANMASLKSAVKKSIREKGKANVFIVATINIGWFGSCNVSSYVKAQLAAAKAACGWSARYKGEKIKPVVYATSLVNKAGVTSAPYNNYLLKLLQKKRWNGNGQIRYLELPNNPGYMDGVHFNKSGNYKVWYVMHKADGHRYKSWVIDRKATLKKNGSMHRVCRICSKKQTKSISRIDHVFLSKEEYLYTGSEIKPSVKALNAKGSRLSKSYYTVTYFNNKEAGTASVEVTFKKRYKGSKRLTFTIRENEAEGALPE